MQVLLRQQRSDGHSDQGTAECHREHKERDRQSVHISDLFGRLAPTFARYRMRPDQSLVTQLALAAPPPDHSAHLPPPLLPASIILSAFSMPNVPDVWLGGYSLKVWRNCPTMAELGINVHSLSPHHRAYISDWSW